MGITTVLETILPQIWDFVLMVISFQNDTHCLVTLRSGPYIGCIRNEITMTANVGRKVCRVHVHGASNDLPPAVDTASQHLTVRY